MTDSATTFSKKKLEQARLRHARLDALRRQSQADSKRICAELNSFEAYLSIASQISVALENLSDQLFRETLTTIEEKLTIALQEILEQPIKLIAEPSWKNNAAAVDFFVQRDGFNEDILKGQGGSVANILSIGLRMFALASLDPQEHRPFLVFDEQDCWLKPELVPRLVKIVHDAGKAIGCSQSLRDPTDRQRIAFAFARNAWRRFSVGNDQPGRIL